MNNIVKTINKRNTGGFIFHYAHFLFDCLFSEIIHNVQNNK